MKKQLIFVVFILGLTFFKSSASGQDSINWSIEPNPFITQTKIDFTLTEPDTVSLIVYDFLGNTVAIFFDSTFLPAGTYNIIFNADTLPDGSYFIFLQCGTIKHSAKAIKSLTASINNSGNSANNFLVSPNPTNGVFAVAVPGELTEPVTVDIIDIYSRNVFHKKDVLPGEVISVDLSTQPPGLYNVYILYKEDIITGKVIIF